MTDLHARKVRPEQEVFDELSSLCASPGYAHAIAYFCFRDHVVGYGNELKGEDYAKLFSRDRLIRTEISTLIGLMLRAPRDFALPKPEVLKGYIERTEALLVELHQAMQQPFMARFRAALTDTTKGKEADPFSNAEAMREPIFYGAESAYSFQYRDLAVRKYAKDRDWLKENKGFTPEEAKTAVAAICELLNDKIITTLKSLKGVPLDQWTLLKGFRFSTDDVVAKSGLESSVVDLILDAFSCPDDNNPTFISLHAFNSVNAFPILKGGDGTYYLFLYMSLVEALYDSPFYWMGADKAYQASAMSHRGEFTEEFTAERLERVFGTNNVFRNVDIWESKARKKKLGEIDTLVIVADRAIVVQAKSKKLTLEARRGNDLQLKSDFKAAVQDACNQALACSQHLVAGGVVFADSAGKEISIPTSIKQIHPVCVVSDHYPALSFQARQFLKFASTDVINPPLVCDVFLIDVLTEFLDTPLRLLSYLELRARAANNIMLSHEITALGFHLRQNLWLGEYDVIMLEDDISTDIDIAMAARRDGVPGEKTPRGVLTELQNTTVGRIISQIEKKSDAGAIGIGLELLKLSGKTAKDLSTAIDHLASSAKDGKEHDVTIGKDGVSGVTIHCNSLADSAAAMKLKQHCEIRKYSNKAPRWCGLVIQPESALLRFGLMLDYPWEHDSALDEVVAKMPTAKPVAHLSKLLKSKAAVGKVSGNKNRRSRESRELIRQTRKFRESLKRRK